jgi:hypothetical protein
MIVAWDGIWTVVIFGNGKEKNRIWVQLGLRIGWLRGDTRSSRSTMKKEGYLSDSLILLETTGDGEREGEVIQ